MTDREFKDELKKVSDDPEAYRALILTQERQIGKKRVEGEDVLEFEETVFSGDVMSVAESQNFPDFARLPKKAQIVLCATAVGYSQPFIAAALGVSQQMVNKYLRTYDPQRRYALSPDAKKAFINKKIDSLILEAAAELSPEKLQESTAKDLSGIMKQLNDIKQSMNATKHKQNKFSALDSYLEDIEEAEVMEDKL